MTMSLAAALIYWVIVAIWLTVLATIVYFYIRNPQAFGTTRLLLAVLCVRYCEKPGRKHLLRPLFLQSLRTVFRGTRRSHGTAFFADRPKDSERRRRHRGAWLASVSLAAACHQGT